MAAAGLPGEWWKQYSDDPTYCLNKIQRKMKEKSSKKRLTLKNVSGAFFFLGIGYALALIAFIFEHFKARLQQNGNTDENQISNKPTSIHPAAITNLPVVITLDRRINNVNFDVIEVLSVDDDEVNAAIVTTNQ